MTQTFISIDVTTIDADISVFHGLFAEGIRVPVETGGSLLDTLHRQVAIPKSYLKDRVQTVFLNGKAVDQLAHEIVTDNAVVALSAAMPGLAGAVFRKGGMLSSLRNPRAGRTRDISSATRAGRITLKLFNLIAAELGPDFLKNGILIGKEQLIRYVDWKKTSLQRTCTDLMMDGRQLEIDDLAVFLERAETEHVRLFANVNVQIIRRPQEGISRFCRRP